MRALENNVGVLIVTYGNRWQFLEKVLRRVLSFEQVTQVIVVNNAAEYNVSDKVKTIGDAGVTVINNAENEGSAGGYKIALNYGMTNTNANFFWLLDDDNLPDEDALFLLLFEWQNIDGTNNKKALFCLREDRVQHIRIAKGEDSTRYLVANNFMGFHVFKIFANQYYKLLKKNKTDKPYQQRVPIPYVPYGGLLLHRQMVEDIGYPDERMFLYVDDSEYTYRITKNKGTIWLIPACKVVDIDQSQGINYKRKFFHSQLLDLWSFRTYYHIRNRMFFYANNFITNNFIFKLNKSLYLGYLKIISLLSSKGNEYKKLLVAVSDGLSGKLGKANEEKF
jgi:GT2 family glycosyltransferase